MKVTPSQGGLFVSVISFDFPNGEISLFRHKIFWGNKKKCENKNLS